MVIERHDVDLPLDLVLRAMFNANGKNPSVIEAAELRWSNWSSPDSTCHRLRWGRLFRSLGGGEGLAADSLTFLQSLKHKIQGYEYIK